MPLLAISTLVRRSIQDGECRIDFLFRHCIELEGERLLYRDSEFSNRGRVKDIEEFQFRSKYIANPRNDLSADNAFTVLINSSRREPKLSAISESMPTGVPQP